MLRMKVRLVAIAICGAILAAGCGAGDDATVSVGEVGGGPQRGDAPERPPGPIQVQSAAQAAKRPEPEVRVPEDLPTEKLVVEDLIKGSGRAVRAGDTIITHFVAVHADGELYETYWAETFRYELPETFIPAWTETMPGMRVGGRRRLIAHPDHLFIAGAPPGVTAEEWTLYYVIDLLGIEKSK